MFDFILPSKIRFGKGIIKELDEELNKISAKKIMLICDEGIIKANILKNVLKFVKEDKIVVVFSKIEANPKDYNIHEGADLAIEEKVDALVAVGGGSAIDAAKGIAVLARQGGNIRDYEKKVISENCLPLIAIPTTSGTGSEITFSSVITDTKENFKFTIKSPSIAARVALIDPELTYSLPPMITASTGIDALTHAIEGYTANCTEPIAEAMGLYAIEYISKYIVRAVGNGADEEAREGMMIGSLLGGLSFSHADVASVHCMAEALGSIYDKPHGMCNSIILPHVMKENLPYVLYKYSRIARAMGVDVKDDETAAYRGIELIEKISKDIALPDFKSLGIDPKDFRLLSELSEKNSSNKSNPKKMTVDDYESLFNKINNI
ncbi:MAG: iron-containing alcohol dehydrogenase [Clostridiales bacterium]|nr:iron-containing alcohol dehydrogenase [Clostridiales bacterium]